MEPRPQRPSRATGPYISTGTPNPPSAGAANTGAGFGTGAFDASGAPPAPPPAIGYDPDYSPGQPLTPLRGPRGANIVGPLLAVAALAIIVAAVAFIVSQFRDGGDDNGAQPTAVVAVNVSPTSDDDQSADGTADDETTAAAADASGDPTQESGGDNSDAGPTNTPRVNRSTESDEDLNPPSDEDEADSDDTAPADRTRARQWLPTTSDIGDGFNQSENGTRTQEEVVASFPEDSNAAEKLIEFGWKENVFRNFQVDGGAATDTTGMTVSVHRFETEAGAKDALPFFAEGSGLATVEDATELGEESITLQGALTGGNAYVIYIRQNEFVLRIGGFSASGDPAELTTAVAEQMLER
jgi:hypothetical protein